MQIQSSSNDSALFPRASLLSADSRESLDFSPLGVGTWSWGSEMWGWQKDERRQPEDFCVASLRAAWQTSLQQSVTFFDTAEMYGYGTSESLIGQFLNDAQCSGDEPIVATKYMPDSKETDRTVKGRMLQHAEQSCSRLGLRCLPLYQIHGPTSGASVEAQADALAAVYQKGLAKSLGVSNFSREEMARVVSRLKAHNLRLSSNQVEFSLLRQHPMHSGLLADCAQQGITLLAYSPLAMGRLTGKYSKQNPPPGRRGFGNQPWPKIDGVLQDLIAIGNKYGKTPSQVALNWVMCQGAVPIPGSKNATQAADNAGALGWRLSDQEVARLSAAGVRGTETSSWQHG